MKNDEKIFKSEINIRIIKEMLTEKFDFLTKLIINSAIESNDLRAADNWYVNTHKHFFGEYPPEYGDR